MPISIFVIQPQLLLHKSSIKMQLMSLLAFLLYHTTIKHPIQCPESHLFFHGIIIYTWVLEFLSGHSCFLFPRRLQRFDEEILALFLSMRFKTSNLKEAKHTDLVSCVSWASPDEVVSIGDDHAVIKWNLVSLLASAMRPMNDVTSTPILLSGNG